MDLDHQGKIKMIKMVMLMMNTYCVSSNMMTALNSFHLMLMTAHKLGNIVTSFYRGGNQSFKRFGYLAKIT